VRAVLSLGSNLGDRRENLRAGIELLGMHSVVVAGSDVYETEPVGGVAQPSFLNCIAVVEVHDRWSALAAAHFAEEARGRLRASRWGPRTLDVDVIDVDGLVSTDPRLTLPHPRAAQRAFVLAPWLEIAPDADVAGMGPAWQLLRAIGCAGVRRVGPL
jgi:2-amino-4-hydroxy-6-hydroxymethyldihydropteridine diphosphokinase